VGIGFFEVFRVAASKSFLVFGLGSIRGGDDHHQNMLAGRQRFNRTVDKIVLVLLHEGGDVGAIQNGEIALDVFQILKPELDSGLFADDG